MNKFAKIALTAGAIASFCLTGCNNQSSRLKLGLVLLHAASESTYDRNFYDAVVSASKELDFDYVVRDNIPEADALCTETCNQLAADGCDIVFADSFGHESNLMEAARAHTDTLFLHATGTQAADSGLDNFFNSFASIYEGRYLAGVAAGYKLQDMMSKENVAPIVGYVAAFPYAEVISGYTSWYLGVKSVVKNATMKVRYSNSWFDYTTEYNLAKKLIKDDGCVLLSQHADSYGAPTACEEENVPNVSYNYSTEKQGPNTYLIASKIDWSAYVKHAVEAVRNGTKVTQDYVGTLANGGVKMLECSNNCPAGTQAKVDEAAAKLKAGTLHVFDTSTFTVNGGETPSDANMAPNTQWTYNYKAGTRFVYDGYFHESESRSAPYLDTIIDGITELAE